MAKDELRPEIKNCIGNLVLSGKGAVHVDYVRETVQDKVSLKDLTREELERVYINQHIYQILHESGFASVVRGQKYFMKMELCRNKAVFDKLIDNTNMDIEFKEKAKRKRIALMEAQCSNLDGQMVFDAETEQIVDDVTLLEILEALSA